MIFAIVAFTTALDYDGLSRIKFLMFTGITGFILALAFMIAYAVGIGAVSAWDGGYVEACFVGALHAHLQASWPQLQLHWEALLP